MALSTKAGLFAKIGGVTTQAITGVGFQPKALLLFSTYQATGNTFEANWWLSYMVTDGTTTFGRSSKMNHWSAGPVIGTYGFSRQAHALPFVEVSLGFASLAAEAAVVSLDSDGFTLNWTTNDGGTTPQILYMALGGSDVTHVKLLGFDASGVAGRQSVAGMGFRPSAVLFLPGFSTTIPASTAAAMHHALGIGVSKDEQWALCGWSKGTGSRPSLSVRHQRDDRCLLVPPDTVSTVTDTFFSGTDQLVAAEAAFVSRDLDGFTIDWKQALSGVTIYALGMQGGRHRAGSFLKLQGSQSQAITHLLMQPAALLLASDMRHEDLVGQPIPATEGKLSLGVRAGSETLAVAVHDADMCGFVAGSTFPINARLFSSSVIGKCFNADAVPSGSVVLADEQFSSFDPDGFTVQGANADALRRQFLYWAIGPYTLASACTGGGAAPTITNPSADASLANATLPLLFVEVALDSGTKRYASVPLADPSTYFGGFKDGRLLSVGSMRRALSALDGTFSVASTTIELDDTDRAIRTLEAAGTLTNRRVDVYAVDDVDRRAGTAARRLGSFVIRRCQPTGDLTVRLELEDWFGSQASEFDTGKLIPARVFSSAVFAGLPAGLEGVPEPIGYGSLSDENAGAEAIGVVPLYYTGQETVSGFPWDRYVLFGHAIKSIQSLFASDLGNNPTGVPRRVKMPASKEGIDFLIPGNAGWNAATGSTNTYRTFSSRRYTVIYARGPHSDAHKSGGITMTANVCGVEATGDGTGTMIDALPSQILHVLVNHAAQTYLTGSWLSVPASNGYSQFASVAAANTTAAANLAGGYLGAFILGGSRGQITIAEFLRQAAVSSFVECGVNRHGQFGLVMEDATAASVATLTDILDLDAQGFDLAIGFDDLANTVPYRYGPTYVDAPASGETIPAWIADTSVQDASAVTAHGRAKNAPALELTLVRDTATADNVAARVLARRTGGAAPYRGPVQAVLTMGLNGTVADLGDPVTVTHFAGLGGGGWTNQKVRVLAVEVDPMTWTTRITGMKL